MMEAKFTKGPWSASEQEENFGGDVFVYGADGRAVARVFSPFAEDRSDARPATAALIATAPDLHEVCAMLVEAQTGTIDGAFRLSVLNDAVARARAALLRASPTEEPALPPQAWEEIDVRDDLEEMIVERWRCLTDEGNGPECPASSPCPECVKRRRAIALIDHRFAKGVAE